MINNILYMVLITLLPFLELRASIPYGILVLEEHWLLVFIVCVITNIILGLLLYAFFDWIVWFMTRVPLLDRFYKYNVKRTQNKIKDKVNKYGYWAVAVFIGIPLPGSGVYSGSLAAYLIGLKYKKFIWANIIGVLIAGIIVTIVVMSGSTMFDIFIKK